MNVYIKKQTFFWQKMALRAVIIVVLIIFLNIFQLQVRNSFYSLSSPLLKVFNTTGNNIYRSLNSFINVKNLTNENNALKAVNQHLLSQVSSLQDGLRQNQLWIQALQTIATPNINGTINNFSIISTKVIGLDILNDTLTINKGLADGIVENMPVISDQKVLYGKVVKVYKNFSQVMLISSKNSVLDIKIQDNDPAKQPIFGAIKGDGGFSVYLDLVTTDAEIKKDDTLITSALEGIFPPNLLVGKIQSTDKNDLKPFQTATVQPFFDITHNDTLFIITDYKK